MNPKVVFRLFTEATKPLSPARTYRNLIRTNTKCLYDRPVPPPNLLSSRATIQDGSTTIGDKTGGPDLSQSFHTNNPTPEREHTTTNLIVPNPAHKRTPSICSKTKISTVVYLIVWLTGENASNPTPARWVDQRIHV